MKMLFAVALLFTVNAQASDGLCGQVKLSFNTHPHRPCPEIKTICISAQEKGDLVLGMENGEEITLAFSYESIEHMSDVGSNISWPYTLNGMFVSLDLNSDGEYPYPTRYPGVEGMSIATGVQERSGVYVSQSCLYDSI